MNDLFVSYKSEDRDRVAPLVAALEADGIAPWWDAHLGGGSAWRDTIEAELTAARCVLVVWSAQSVGPDGSFVRDEATRALERGAYLPVKIDDVRPPLGFGETQALPLIGWNGNRADARYVALLAAARAVIAGEPRPVPVAVARRSGLDRRIVIGGGVAAAAAAGAGGWWAVHRRPDAAQDSVAVLPFANLSGDPAQAYFSDGIAEELRGALTRIVRLKVAARTSSELMRNADAPTAAAKLGVANIVTGSVRRGADTIRVSAELVDGTSGLSKWSQAYDRAAGDALAIETGIAESVANALNLALGRAEKKLLSTGGTANSKAHDAYLRGRALSDVDDNTAALQAFDVAVAADPEFALAHAERAAAISAIASQSIGGAALRAKLMEAEAEARRAVALAPGLGWPLSILSYVLSDRLDLRGSTAASAAGYRAAPGDAEVVGTYAGQLSLLGRHAEAVALGRKALALNPLAPLGPREMGQILLQAGEFDEAIAAFRQSLAHVPTDRRGRRFLAMALIGKGQPADALRVVASLGSDAWERLTVEAIATTLLGDRAASDRALAELVRLHDGDSQYQIAEVHAQRGEVNVAFATIGRAWDLLDPGLIYLKTDPLLAPLHADPRYAAWLLKIGFP